MWVDKPLAHYQIVDLEDIVYVKEYPVAKMAQKYSLFNC